MTGLCDLLKCSSGRAQYGSRGAISPCLSRRRARGLIKLSSYLVIRGLARASWKLIERKQHISISLSGGD